MPLGGKKEKDLVEERATPDEIPARSSKSIRRKQDQLTKIERDVPPTLRNILANELRKCPKNLPNTHCNSAYFFERFKIDMSPTLNDKKCQTKLTN
jgi:hypothetical protein